MRRYLAFDLGLKRTGVALVDDNNKVATPLGTIAEQPDSHKYLLETLNYIYEWEPYGLVFGLPIDMKGKHGIAADNVKIVVDSLLERIKTELTKKSIDMPEILFHDERLTSAQVEKNMKKYEVSRENRSKIRDSLAACVIAQSFIDSL
ncbi:MAG: Holliday junction resolvase RuvX [Acidimicrobiia bacterium]